MQIDITNIVAVATALEPYNGDDRLPYADTQAYQIMRAVRDIENDLIRRGVHLESLHGTRIHLTSLLPVNDDEHTAKTRIGYHIRMTIENDKGRWYAVAVGMKEHPRNAPPEPYRIFAPSYVAAQIERHATQDITVWPPKRATADVA